MSNTTEDDWDESSPAINQPRRNGAVEINALRQAVRLRMAREHELFDELGVGGEHLQGSAKIYVDTTEPTLRPDGTTVLDADDIGRLFWNTDTDRMYVWDGDSWELFRDVTEDNFSVTNSAPFGLPLTAVNPHSGQWMVFVYGSVANNTLAEFTVSVTLDGVTKTITYPAATSPSAAFGRSTFCLPFNQSHSTGDMTVSAASNCLVQGMTGVRIT